MISWLSYHTPMPLRATALDTTHHNKKGITDYNLEGGHGNRAERKICQVDRETDASSSPEL